MAIADGPDPLTALQGRRIALQARSTTFAYLGAQVGWWLSAFRSQIEAREGGQRQAIKNLSGLISERGALRRLAQAFLSRRRHLLHLLLYLSLFLVH